MPAFQINGIAPEALGVRMASRTLRSLAPSTVSLDIVDASLVQSRLYRFTEPVTITAGGRIVFKGRVVREADARTMKSWGRQIELRDIWWDLQNSDFSQVWDGARTQHVTIGGYAQSRNNYNTVVDEGHIQMVTAYSILDEVLNFAVTQKNIPLQYWLHSTGPLVVPYNVGPRRVAEIILGLLGHWSPSTVSWVDYGTDPVTLHFAEWPELAGAAGVLGWTMGNGQSFHFDPQDEFRLSEMEMFFEQIVNGEVVIADSQLAQIAGDAAPKVAVTFRLPEGSKWDTGGQGTPFDSQNNALAPYSRAICSQLFQHWTRRYWSGEAAFIQDEPLSDNYMGRIFNAVGGPPEWATMSTPVTEQTDDFQTGRGSIKTGLNRSLIVEPSRLGDRTQKPTAQSARNGQPPSKPNPGPLEAYIEKASRDTYNLLVSTGICGKKIKPGGAIDDNCPDQTTGLNPVTNATQRTVLKMLAKGMAPVTVWLWVVFRPDVQAFDVVDSLGHHYTEYKPLSGGNVTSSRFDIRLGGDPAAPVVDPTNGAITTYGLFYFRWATVTWAADADSPTVTSHRKGNKDLVLIPPNRLVFKSIS
jgi:hypothetical protein